MTVPTPPPPTYAGFCPVCDSFIAPHAMDDRVRDGDVFDCFECGESLVAEIHAYLSPHGSWYEFWLEDEPA